MRSFQRQLIGGLKDLLSGEHVPGGDQQLARDRGLRRVGAVAGSESPVVLVEGVGRPPGLVGGLDRRPAKRARAGLRQPPGGRALARLADPRRQPRIADQFDAEAKRETSPISAARVRPIKGPIPGIVCSSRALGSERAIGASSESIGVILRSSSSICRRWVAIDSRQTSGTPRCSSSSTSTRTRPTTGSPTCRCSAGIATTRRRSPASEACAGTSPTPAARRAPRV